MVDRPLTELLSKALDAFARDVDGRRDADMPRLSVWANVLQHLDQHGVDQKDLPRLARLSRRALPPALTPLRRSGHITMDAKRIRLTPMGRAATEDWPVLLADAERRWRRQLGAARMTSLRRTLERLVAQLELVHPDFPTQYGPVDPTITGGPGKDWKPVPRTPEVKVKGEPLTALLSQALVGAILSYEPRGGPLQWVVLLQSVADRGVRIDDLPDTPFVPTMARHGFVKLSSDGQKVHHTPLSKRMRDGYQAVSAAVEAEWRTRFGDELVDELRQALEAIAQALDPDDELPKLMPLSSLWSDARWANR